MTNFNKYVEIFAEKFNVPILGRDANMISASAEGDVYKRQDKSRSIIHTVYITIQNQRIMFSKFFIDRPIFATVLALLLSLIHILATGISSPTSVNRRGRTDWYNHY